MQPICCIPSDKKTGLSLRRVALPILLPGLLGVAGCHQGYSPNTYAATAAQVEATVQRGIIIGVRQVLISSNGVIGAAAGGAAGGVAGSQISGPPVVSALGAIGGGLVGGIGGDAAAQAVADNKGWEYIVQESGDKLVSVTQTSKISLPIGLHVLVIAGTQQARIVPDYTVQVATPGPKPATADMAATSDLSDAAIRLGPIPPDDGAAGALPVAQPAAPAAAVPPPPPASALGAPATPAAAQ
jgi:outer membrane lipoprotein SlyB